MKEFPPFRLDPINQCLWRPGDEKEKQRILLTPKAFAMLSYLVERAGRLVTQDELLEALWPETYVQPEVLKSHIRDIRAALGDDSKSPRFIETLPRRGYRFVAAVSEGPGKRGLRVDEPTPAIVGRGSELDRLQGLLQRALQGERQLVFVTGEAGIGKTALADTFERRAAAAHPGLRIARGQCVEGYGGTEPYYPMLEALRQLCNGPEGDSVVRALASHAPTWLVQFPALVKREQRESLHREIVGATRERMLREIADALEAIKAERPLLLVLSDLHWADSSTIDLISVLARRRQPARLMLIATYRPVDVALADHPLKALKQDLLIHHLCHEIALEPLGEAEVAQYLSLELAGFSVPEGLAELIYRRSEGNPLFMVAALTHMRDRGLVEVENGSWKLRMPLEQMEVLAPEGLRRMIELQIERLSPEEQRVLEVASVLKEFSLSVAVGALVANIEPETLEELLEGLARRHQVIRPAGFRDYLSGPSPCYEFVHVLYRDVLYARIGSARRRKLHKSMAEHGEALHLPLGADTATAFLETGIANELAHQFEQCGDWLSAIKYLQIASDTAARRFEPTQAAETIEHALELVKNMPETERAATEIELLQKLCTIYSTSFDPRALQTYEILAGRAAEYGLADVEVHALLEMAFPVALVSCEVYESALTRAFEAHLRSAVGDASNPAAIRALYLPRRMAAGKCEPGNLEECRQLVAELHEIEDRALFGEVQLGFGYSLFQFSEYREARRRAVGGFADFSEGYEKPYLSWHFQMRHHVVASSLLFLGEWGEALREIEQYLKLVEKNGDRYNATLARLRQVELQIRAMDFSGAQRILESVYAVVDTIPYMRRNWMIWAGSAEAGLGNHDRALKQLLSCREEMDKNPLLTDWYNRMPLQQSLTEAWLTKGELEKARVEAEEFLRATLSTEERTYRALAFETSARVAIAEGDLPKAEDGIEKAEQEMEGYETPLAAWRVHATASEVYERIGERESAKRHLELSRDTIMNLGNSVPVEEPLRERFLSAPAIRKILANEAVHAKTV
jgi:DNA-binding winged helix-turn-helix (wHTH) protein/tetratricopeptide (TPR) repeat protein